MSKESLIETVNPSHRYSAVLPDILLGEIANLRPYTDKDPTGMIKISLKLRELVDSETEKLTQSGLRSPLRVGESVISQASLREKYSDPHQTRFNLVLPEDSFTKFSVLAAHQGIKFAKYLRQAVSLGVGITKEAVAQKLYGVHGQYAIPLSIGPKNFGIVI